MLVLTDLAVYLGSSALSSGLFVDLPPGVTVSTTAHAMGGLAGALVAIVRAFGARQGRDFAVAR